MLTVRNTCLHHCAFLFVFLAVSCVAAHAEVKKSISVTVVKKEHEVVSIQIKFPTPFRKEDQDAGKLGAHYPQFIKNGTALSPGCRP